MEYVPDNDGITRYVDTLSGEGSTMDAVSLLIEADRTDVTPVLDDETGLLIVDAREFPLPRFAEGRDLSVATQERLGGVVDIARPRDIDPAADALASVVVHDIDDLETVTEQAHEQRRAAARQVEAMIDEEHDRLLSALKRARADEAIRGMYEGAERMKGRELDRALTKLEAQGELNDDQRETVEALADSLVSQLLAPPTESLREAAGEDDWNTIRTAMELFDPTVDAVDAEGAPDHAEESAGE